MLYAIGPLPCPVCLSATLGGCGHKTRDMARKRGAAICPFHGELGPRLIQCGLGQGYFRTKRRLHPSSRLATIDMNLKLRAVPLLGGAATPSNTTSPGPTFTSVPSGMLIYTSVWPQQTWAKNWVGSGCVLFSGGSRVPIEHKVAWTEAYLHNK